MKTLKTAATNIRSVADAELRPHPTGLTSISGTNGAGKSTLVSVAPLLAGWGYTPPGTTLASIIREGEDKASATWEFDVNGTVYTVTREFRRTKNGASASRAKLAINGSYEDTKGMKPSDVTEEVTRILGATAPEFLTTSMIAQGDVDALMSETPANVEKAVRKILGLDLVRLAADRQKRALANLKLPEAPDMTVIEEMEGDVARYSGLVQGAEDQLAPLMQAKQEAEQEAAQKRSDYDSLRKAAESVQRFDSQAARFQALVEQSAKAVEQREREVESAFRLVREGENMPQGADSEDIEAVMAAVVPLVEKWGTPQGYRDLTQAQQVLATPPTITKGGAKEALDETEAALTKAQHEAQEATQEVERRAEALAEARQEEREALADREGAAAVYALIQDHGDELDDGCPLCGSDTTSESASKRVSDRRAEVENQFTQAKARVSNAEAQVKEATREHNEAQRAASSASRNVTQCEFALQSAKANQRKAEDEANERARYEGIVEETGGYEAVEKCYNLVEARHNLAEARQHHAKNELQLDDLGQRPEPIDPEALAQAERNAESAKKNAWDANSAVVTVTRDRDRAKQERDTMKARLAGALERRELLEKAKREQTAKRYAAQLLEEFSLVYTLERVGLISEAVNALLPLSGLEELSEFVLDKDFTPTVVVSGVRRKTSDLSGGERAILGLLMRLGIVAAIGGGALESTIVADEPLAALDEQARARVVSVLAKLPCPVVVISHTSEAAEAASKRVVLNRLPGGATEVMEMA